MPILEVQQRCLQDDVGLFSLHQHVILDRLIARGVSELVCISEIPKSPSCWLVTLYIMLVQYSQFLHSSSRVSHSYIIAPVLQCMRLT